MSSHPPQNHEEGFFSFFPCCGNNRDKDDYSDADDSSRFLNEASGTGKEEDQTYLYGQVGPSSDTGSGNPDWTDVEDYQYQSNPNLNHPQQGYGSFQYTHQNDVVIDPQEAEPLDLEYIRKKSRESDEDREGSEISSHSKKITKPNKQKKRRGSRGSNESKEGKGRNKRRPWQPHEDAKVLELVGKYGQSWALLASMLTGRTGKQIRDRFLNKLKPNIKKGDWSQSEDALLVQLYYQIGHKWSKIATYLPGRTEGQVKNRFYSHVKKKILKDVPDPMSSPSAEESTSPMTKAETSPVHSQQRSIKLEPVPQQQQKPVVYYTQPQQNQQYGTSNNHNNFPTQNGYGAQRQTQYQADPTDLISYESSYNTSNHSNGHLGANDQNNALDSFVSYNAPPVQLENEIDSVLTKYASFFDAPSTQGGNNTQNLFNLSPESGETFEKLDRIDQLKNRKKNLEYLLQMTMQEIKTGYTGQQLNGFH